MRVKSLAIIGAMALAGCVSDDDTQRPVEADFNFTAMLANYADNIIIPQYESFSELVTTLENDITVYCDGLQSQQEASSLAQAQNTWTQSMSSWQLSELYWLGPVVDPNLNFRDDIYSYATPFAHSSCAVDKAVVLAQQPDFDVESQLQSARGLDALEYLLFNESLLRTCPSQVQETQDWNALSDEVKKLQRCQYAQVVTENIIQKADELLEQWRFSGGDYRTEFINASNAAESVEALSDALFYMELEVKDKKLAIPTGLKSCQDVACPEKVELLYSQQSLAMIRANLTAFMMSIKGQEGLGFDDLLLAKDPEAGQELLTFFEDTTHKSIALIDSMDTSLYQQTNTLLQSNDRSVCANSSANPEASNDANAVSCRLHGYIKQITDRLKIDFITIIDLDIPDRGQGDND